MKRGRRKSYITRYHELCQKAKSELKQDLINMNLTKFNFDYGEVEVKTNYGIEHIEYVEIDTFGSLVYDTYEKIGVWVDASVWIEIYNAFLMNTGTFNNKFKY